MSIFPETLAMSTKYIFPFSFSHIVFIIYERNSSIVSLFENHS